MDSRTVGTIGLALALGALALAGCTSSHGRGGDAGGGEACGAVTCDPGLVCCNASCGICARPGEGCPAIACLDAGTGEACGSGTCGPGERCCEGCSDADAFCVPAGSPCPAAPCADGGPIGGGECGGWSGRTCGPDEVCDYPDGSFCGGDDSFGVCIPRPEPCPEPACRPVCGCDGDTYCSECDAHAAGTDVLHEGECPPEECGGMDAHGDGLCDAFFGIAWNGRDCLGISGCSCVGSDCDGLYDSYDACIDAHATCIDDCRVTGCAADERCEPCWDTFACLPDGAVC